MERFRLPWACYAYRAYGYVANYLILPRTTERVHWDERGLARASRRDGGNEGARGRERRHTSRATAAAAAAAAVAAAAADTKDFSTSNRGSTRWQP